MAEDKGKMKESGPKIPDERPQIPQIKEDPGTTDGQSAEAKEKEQREQEQKAKAAERDARAAEFAKGPQQTIDTRHLPPTLPRLDPSSAFNFFVEIDGIKCAEFRSVSGLDWSVEVESFYQGGENRHKVNLMGKGSFSTLKLKKGFFSIFSEFYFWMKHLMNPGLEPVTRVTLSVVVLADDGLSEMGRFNLYNAFMSKYTGPTFDATQNDIAFEEIEITYDYFEYLPLPEGLVVSNMLSVFSKIMG